MKATAINTMMMCMFSGMCMRCCALGHHSSTKGIR